MRHKEVIYFISEQVTEDDIGNQIPSESERQVFANEMSIGQSEFYNAGANGLKPQKMFEVYSFEYQGESKLRHNEKHYEIIRTESKGEKIRIVCTKVVGHG